MGHISGVSHFYELNRRFGGDPEEFLPAIEAAVESLSGPSSLAELAGVRVGADDLRHFEGHWLDAWWPEHQPVEPILRRGLLEAFTRARDAAKPMQTIVVAGAADTFEVAVLDGTHQVTMVMLTPASPQGAEGVHTDVTVVRRRNGEVVVE